MKRYIIITGICLLVAGIQAQEQINVSGVFPHLAMVGGHELRTEAGVGALFPWADRLWIVTYVAHVGSETGFGTNVKFKRTVI